MSWRMLILAASGLLFAALAHADSLSRSFTIDAEYRGLIRKSFPAIGRAGLAIQGPTEGFRIQGKGAVTNPCDKSKVYELSIDMRFRLDGARVDYLATNNSCNKGSEDLRAQMERVLPFVYLVQTMPVPAEKRRGVITPHGEFEMVYGVKGASLEIAVLQKRAQVAKFFLSRTATGADLRSFRLPGKDSVQLSFNAGPGLAD
jgi:hypothetical protein